MFKDFKFLSRAGAASFGSLVLLYAIRRHRINEERKLKIDKTAVRVAESGSNKKRRKPAVNAKFFQSFKKILSIIAPRGWVSAEGFYAVFVAGMLVLRTVIDIWMIGNATKIERSIIDRNGAGFRKYITRFLAIMLPMSVVNQGLKLGLQEMKIRFRVNLTEYLFKQYLNEFVYYQVSNIDTRMENVDQLLTNDVDKFAQSVVDLYSNISKPVLDVVIYAKELVGSHGASAPTTMLGYLVGAAALLTTLRRPLSRFTVQEQQLEGEFRYVNSRLITNSEEIAFYGGNDKEAHVVSSVFNRLVLHLRRAMEFRFSMGVIDNIGAKYMAMLVGFFVVSRPFLDLSDANAAFNGMSSSDRMEHYYNSGRILVKLGEAVGRIVLAGRELSRLAGFTDRVDQLVHVLDDLAKGKYERTLVAGSEQLVKRRGKLTIEDNVIDFHEVPLLTPNGDVLVESLTFRIEKGVNTFVAGPNGCGKSSLFRVLGELWPLYGGKLTKPDKDQLFYVPQRPYMTLGTLRDQIIYPDDAEKMKRKGLTDEHLMELMRIVKLEHLIEREGGFDAVNDYMDVLSGGEKQRIGFARMFYSKPQFCILDECTSAVSIDVEAIMYNTCREFGITLFTISHRHKTLAPFHEKILSFDGKGSYEFKDMKDFTLY